MVSRQGFEPRLTVLETAVLPLTPARYMVASTRIELVMAGYQPTVIPFNYKAMLGGS